MNREERKMSEDGLKMIDLGGLEDADDEQFRGVPRIEHSRNEVHNRGKALDEIWWQGRQWAVTSFGLECREGNYYIEACQFVIPEWGERTWLHQMQSKFWVDVEDFATAWFVAQVLHGPEGERYRNIIRALPPVRDPE